MIGGHSGPQGVEWKRTRVHTITKERVRKLPVRTEAEQNRIAREVAQEAHRGDARARSTSIEGSGWGLWCLSVAAFSGGSGRELELGERVAGVAEGRRSSLWTQSRFSYARAHKEAFGVCSSMHPSEREGVTTVGGVFPGWHVRVICRRRPAQCSSQQANEQMGGCIRMRHLADSFKHSVKAEMFSIGTNQARHTTCRLGCNSEQARTVMDPCG